MASLRWITQAPLLFPFVICSAGCGSSTPDGSPPPVGVTAGDASVPVDSGGRGGGGAEGGGGVTADASEPAPDPFGAKRAACGFTAGATSLETLGVSPAIRAKIPIEH